MRRRLLIAVLLGALAGALFFAPSASAYPDDDPDTVAIRSILAAHNSPLPWWTVAAFTAAHDDFDVAGYLTVMSAESSLGTTGGSFRYNNPGNLKWAGWQKPGGPVWYVWMNGSWWCEGQGRYGTYSSMYWGQRAAIRMIYDADSPWGHSMNALLAAHDWDTFSRHYFGANVPGRAAYAQSLAAIHARLVKEAAGYGVAW